MSAAATANRSNLALDEQMSTFRNLSNRQPGSISAKFLNTAKANWYLGFYAFGGPPVHFKIFREKFVQKYQWIDEQIYQELFSVCQAFSGPGSTKMHYCINLIHNGFLPAVFSFLIWSLPGAFGMYGVSVGVSNIGQSLPRAVYALLSGLNSATVGIIALAAVQLAEKAVTDRLTRVLVFLGAAAGMLYNALWYFPVLILLAAITAVVFDYRWLDGPIKTVTRIVMLKKLRRFRDVDRGSGGEDGTSGNGAAVEGIELHDAGGNNEDHGGPSSSAAQEEAFRSGVIKDNPALTRRLPITNQETAAAASDTAATAAVSTSNEPRVIPTERRINISWQFGLFTIGLFLISFVVVMVLRGVLPSKPLLYSLFANMYLAGTIIFGGGPVVVPLLRSYVVDEGWVSTRDFLIGLALIQGFPGPNFNFAVYLGSLTAIGGGYNSAAGALLGFLGIFLPGLVTIHGTMGLWSALRSLRWVRSALRGVNAAAVGLIFTAVYRLWQIGWIDEDFQQGTSLANDPWWVVVTATSYVGGYWFGLNPPMAIVLGAAMGLIRYGIVSA